MITDSSLYDTFLQISNGVTVKDRDCIAELTVDGHPDGVLDGAAPDVGVLGAAGHRLQVVARPRPEVHARHRQRLAARRARKLKLDQRGTYINISEGNYG